MFVKRFLNVHSSVDGGSGFPKFWPSSSCEGWIGEGSNLNGVGVAEGGRGGSWGRIGRRNWGAVGGVVFACTVLAIGCFQPAVSVSLRNPALQQAVAPHYPPPGYGYAPQQYGHPPPGYGHHAPPPPQYAYGAPPAAAPAAAPAPEEPEGSNPHLLSLENSIVPTTFEEFVENNKNTMPSCGQYRNTPGSCDPELSINRCVACISTAHFGSYDGCPGPESFRNNLKWGYEWQYAGATKAKFKRRRHVCLVKNIPKSQMQPDQEETFVMPESSGSSNTMLLIGVGVGGVVLLMILGCLALMCFK